MYDGMKVPAAEEAIESEDHAREVSLSTLLTEMGASSLDFIRQCLLIDGKDRISSEKLLEHEYFDQDFKEKHEAEFVIKEEADKLYEGELAKIQQKTKDGRDEIPAEELATDDEDEKQEKEENPEDGETQKSEDKESCDSEVKQPQVEMRLKPKT